MPLAKAHMWSCLAIFTSCGEAADSTPAHILTGSYIELTDAAAVATGTLSRSVSVGTTYAPHWQRCAVICHAAVAAGCRITLLRSSVSQNPSRYEYQLSVEVIGSGILHPCKLYTLT